MAFGLSAAMFFMPAISGAANIEEILQKLQERVEALEKKNIELEKKNAELENRLQKQVTPATTGDTSLAERVKTLEEKSGKLIDKFAGIELGGSLNMTLQGTKNNDDNKAPGTNRGDKADVSMSAGLDATIPVGEMGELFLRTLITQGEGVTRWLPSMFASPNADLEYDDSQIRLVEAWYQGTINLPWGASGDESKHSLVFNIGKMDPTGFFDTNNVANSEDEQFMADIFKNNITLEWGGDDNAYGPGLRLAYINKQRDDLAWNLSFGFFEGNSDEDGTFQDVMDRPFVIGEGGITKKFGELEGNYRLYGWVNRGKHTEWKDTAKDNAENIGWGISVDQQVSTNVTLFARYGMQDEKVATFDHTFSIGGQTLGTRWNRPNDVLAAAYGFSSPSHDFKKVAETHPDYGYRVRESEHYIEAYYRIQVNDQLAITPDIQYVMNPGGDDEKDDFLIYALRMVLTF
ncbi:MAG: carbohydrate porin [Nitrospirota bacterium]|nr:carbohydrate porin [Nitrospirota bacterium]